MQRIMIMTFTDRGYELGIRISKNIYQEESHEIRVLRVAHGTLKERTAAAWKEGCDLVFISAAGIAVRAVAGLIGSKLEDRAVIAMDEEGRSVVPLLSGHVGGADRLARTIAGFTGGRAVITSASDMRGVRSFDAWASERGFAILNKELIAPVYDKVLAHEELRILCESYEGEVPFSEHKRINTAGERIKEGELNPDAVICGSCSPDRIIALLREYGKRALIISSRNLIIGVGCRKGVPGAKILECVSDICEINGLDMRLIGKLATINLKKEEEGIKSVCAVNRWELEAFTAEELKEAAGDFEASPFVEETTGVDNVCERSVVRAGGKLLLKKTRYEGVTVAVGTKA